jgi:molybdenum cofactor cytidylyltransferase
VNIGAILLAAGASRRMGAPKQLIRFDGHSLLRRAAETAIGSGASPVIVVLGARAEDMLPELADLPIEAVINPDWALGMSASLRCGIQALLALAPETEAVLVTLCDQPFVTGAHLGALIERFRAPITASLYNSTLGVPAVFARALFPELEALEGDSGARRLIQLHSAETTAFDLPEAAIDLDSPIDLNSFSAKLH